RRAQAFMDARVHKTIATLRRDGSPRISGIEARFGAGDLSFGSMPRALKALDLLRDARFALHSGSEDPPEWEGDAKVSGRAIEVTDPDEKSAWFAKIGHGGPSIDAHLFRAQISEVAVVRLNEARDGLIIESWHEGRGVRSRERQ
ncbi:MAG TPA: pyridoxamine 5'-phosphate oxidase family protein, partial [Solirubrobacteraceae bacterium]|nr:pyridoxamine 5'-phosphate oxidase family protein [Solirubrobacteraceae bacterium]